MNLRKIDKFQMDNSIKMALKEDITSEDISTMQFIRMIDWQRFHFIQRKMEF